MTNKKTIKSSANKNLSATDNYLTNKSVLLLRNR